MAMQLPHSQAQTPFEIFLQPSLKAGAWAGISGLLVGSVVGVFRSTTPAYFAVASGIQSFGLGSFYWCLRTGLLRGQVCGPDSIDPSARLRSSVTAGAVTGGMLSAIRRSPGSAIPGILLFSGLGYGGQKTFNVLDDWHTRNHITNSLDPNRGELPKKQGYLDRLASMKWSPVEKMSDREYAEYLEEKVVGLEAELALLDDGIKAIKEGPN